MSQTQLAEGILALDLIAFLKALDSAPLPPALTTPPTGPC
jgi:hypothetical protein